MLRSLNYRAFISPQEAMDSGKFTQWYNSAVGLSYVHTDRQV